MTAICCTWLLAMYMLAILLMPVRTSLIVEVKIKAFMVKCVYLLHDIITSMMQSILERKEVEREKSE